MSVWYVNTRFVRRKATGCEITQVSRDPGLKLFN